MESVFMARRKCKLRSPPPPLPHYCPSQARTLTREQRKICVSPVWVHRRTEEDGMEGGCRGDKTTPTTLWRLQQPAIYDGGSREEEEEEEGSDSTSQYNECWQSSSTVDTTGEGEGEGELERGGESVAEEGEREGGGSAERVDGATGQPTIAKYIERFRKAPPTPRGGRRVGDRAGVGGNFWWHRPPQGATGAVSPESDPSLPRSSHSTPDTTSESSTPQLGTWGGGEEGGDGARSLEERAREALQRSSALLDSAPVGVATKPLPPRPRPIRQLLPPPSAASSALLWPVGGAEEEDILYQWRLRRRLEQAHRSTSVLTSRLSHLDGRPLFISRPTGGGGATGRHLPTAGAGGGVGVGVRGGEGGAVRAFPTETAPADVVTCHPTGTPPLLPHRQHAANTSHTSAPTDWVPVVAHPSPPHQAPPIHHCCLPPHRHTACDITPCSSHTPPVELGGQLRAKGRERRKEEGGKRGKKKGETRERERWQATPEQRVPSALLPPSEADCVENILPLTSSPAQPPVRYPSPTLLNHMRRPRQSHDNHPPHQSPGGREEETELSTTASDTFLSTTAGSTPYHTPSPPDNVGRLVTEAIQQHLLHEKIPPPEIKDTLTVTAADYGEDMGDPVLSALISRAKVLEHQLRKIHSLLSVVEDN